MAQPQISMMTKFVLKNEQGREFPLEKAQTIIGSADGVDIFVAGGDQPSFDAIIVQSDGKLTLTKTNPLSSVLVNGQDVLTHELKSSDQVSIRNISFTLSLKEVPKEHVKTDLKSTSKPKNIDGLTYVDDDYFDLDFSTTEKVNLSHSPSSEFIVNESDYIDAELEEPVALFEDGKEFTRNKTLEVIFSTHGNILSFDSFPLDKIKSQRKYLSDDIMSFFPNKKFSLVEKKGESLLVNLPEGFILNSDSQELAEDKTLILVNGFNQIAIRLGKELGAIKFIPSYVRSFHEFKKLAMTAMLSFLPFLFLLLINTKQVEEKKQEKVVIFKKKIEKKKVVLKEPTATKSDDVKNIDSPQKKVAKKVSEKKSEISKKSNQKVTQTTKRTTRKSTRRVVKNNTPSQTIKSQETKVSNKPTTPKVSLASSFSKMMGTSQIKSKSFAKSGSGASKGTSKSSGLNAAKTGRYLASVGGGIEDGKLGSSSQFGSGKGHKSKGLGKSNFTSDFTKSKTIVMGSLDPKVIDRILREHMPQFRHCYQGELSKNPDARGSVNMDFTIGSSGRVTATNSKSRGSVSRSTAGCVNQVLSRIQFPSPKGGGIVDVTKPLNFTASSVKI